MIDTVKRHLKGFALNDLILHPHPRCKATELVLPYVIAFKNHTAIVHKIKLRKDQAACVDTPLFS